MPNIKAYPPYLLFKKVFTFTTTEQKKILQINFYRTFFVAGPRIELGTS